MEMYLKSEVARLLAQIDQEYASARNGMQGLSQGSARHDFITQKMRNAGELQDQLEKMIGKQEALKLICEQASVNGEQP